MRFISRDSYDLSNRYAYCDGDPVSNVDFTGHNKTQDICMWINIGLGALGIVAFGTGAAPIGLGLGVAGNIANGIGLASDSESSKWKTAGEVLAGVAGAVTSTALAIGMEAYANDFFMIGDAALNNSLETINNATGAGKIPGIWNNIWRNGLRQSLLSITGDETRVIAEKASTDESWAQCGENALKSLSIQPLAGFTLGAVMGVSQSLFIGHRLGGYTPIPDESTTTKGNKFWKVLKSKFKWGNIGSKKFKCRAFRTGAASVALANAAVTKAVYKLYNGK